MKLPGVSLPDVQGEIASFREELQAIRRLLERLLELEEQR